MNINMCSLWFFDVNYGDMQFEGFFFATYILHSIQVAYFCLNSLKYNCGVGSI